MSQQPQPQSQPRDLLADLERHTLLLEAQVAKLTKALDHWRLLQAEYEALGDEVDQARTRFAADDAPTRQKRQAELVRIRRDFDGQLVDHKTVCELFGARLGQTITRSVDHIASAIGRRLDYVQQNVATLQKQVETMANKLAAVQVVSRPEILPRRSAENGDGDGGGDDDDEAAGEGEGGDSLGDDDFDGPLTDIVEQLDDDDNVINVQLHTPSSTQPQVLEVLKKAGVEEIPAGGPAEAKKSTNTGAGAETMAAGQEPQAQQQPKQAPKFKPNTSAKPQPKPRKGVSFTENTKPGDRDAPPPSSSPSSSFSQPQSFAAQRLGNIMRSAKDQEALVDASTYIVPEDEADDDAALRREMLEYSRTEIGPIVAQLDIEEGLSDDDEGYNDDEYDDDDDDYDDDDDENGRAKYSVIDEAYRERMRELERKLGVAPLANPSTLAPGAVKSGGAAGAAATTTDDIAESLGRIRVSGLAAASNTPGGAQANGEQSPKQAEALTSVLKEPTENFRTKIKATGSDAKKVSFASAVEIAPPELAPTVPPVAVMPKALVAPSEPIVEPLSDVIERKDRSSSSSSSSNKSNQAPALPDSAGAQKPKRVSRFKKALGDGTSAASEQQLPKGPHEAPVRFLDQDRTVAPSGPEGQTHAEAVVERQALTEPKEPDELDAGLLLQEAATDYHRTRNRLIQQQGGFLQASESAVVPVGEDDGGPRISKFKAARLGKQFMSP